MTEQTALGWTSIAAGGVGVLAWALLWTGRWRSDWVQDYRAARAPAWRRNRAFASLPAGICFASGGIAVVLPRSWFGLAAVLLYLFLVAGALVLLIVFIGPPWAKPPWVRDLDATDWQGFQPEGRSIGRALKVLMLSIIAGMFLALIHQATIWDFVAPVLMGIAASIGVGASGNRRPRGS